MPYTRYIHNLHIAHASLSSASPRLESIAVSSFSLYPEFPRAAELRDSWARLGYKAPRAGGVGLGGRRGGEVELREGMGGAC